jgi:hypothetical protein
MVNIPEDKPAISVDIPDSWKPEETDKGIACESPDKLGPMQILCSPPDGELLAESCYSPFSAPEPTDLVSRTLARGSLGI